MPPDPSLSRNPRAPVIERRSRAARVAGIALSLCAGTVARGDGVSPPPAEANAAPRAAKAPPEAGAAEPVARPREPDEEAVAALEADEGDRE